MVQIFIDVMSDHNAGHIMFSQGSKQLCRVELSKIFLKEKGLPLWHFHFSFFLFQNVQKTYYLCGNSNEMVTHFELDVANSMDV